MTQPSQGPEQDPAAVPPPPPVAPNPPPASEPPAESPPLPPGASTVPPANPTQPLYPGAQYGTPQAPVPYPPAPAGPPPQATNGMSIAALVVGIVGAIGVCCYGVGGYIGAVGAILGHVSRRQIARNSEGGGPLALTGIIVGWIATGISVIATIFWIWFFIMAVNDPTFLET